MERAKAKALARPNNNRYNNGNQVANNTADPLLKPGNASLSNIIESCHNSSLHDLQDVSFDIEKVCIEKDENLQKAMQRNLNEKHKILNMLTSALKQEQANLADVNQRIEQLNIRNQELPNRLVNQTQRKNELIKNLSKIDGNLKQPEINLTSTEDINGFISSVQEKRSRITATAETIK